MSRASQLSRRPQFYPFDWGVIIYSLLMLALIVAFGRPLADFYDEIIFYAFVVGLATIIVRYLRENRSRFEAFIRTLYPAILFTFFYRTTGGTMFLLFDRFYDFQLTNFEAAILGTNPTLFIDRYWLNPWVTEILSMCYFAYYLMIPTFFLILFFQKRHDILKPVQTAVLITFFFSYLLFFLYPIEGPRWHFADRYQNPLEGYVFRNLVEFVIANGAVRGGCMPSTHFAVAVVILMFCYRHFRKTTHWLLPIVVGLGAGTVWGRFHYISDVVVGGAIALIVTGLVWRYYEIWAGQPTPRHPSTDGHVS